MANHSQPESESASTSTSETEPQMFGCSGWAEGWMGMWLGWLLVTGIAAATANDREKAQCQPYGEERRGCEGWLGGKIALE